MAETVYRIDARRDSPGYATDYAAWIEHQRHLLERHAFEQLDLENLIDEVGSLGRSDFRRFTSAIELVLVHMLKWDHQPQLRSRSWQGSIIEHRARIVRELRDSPSYRARIEEAVSDAYASALGAAVRETDLPLAIFPQTCPYDWDMITTREHHREGDD